MGFNSGFKGLNSKAGTQISKGVRLRFSRSWHSNNGWATSSTLRIVVPLSSGFPGLKIFRSIHNAHSFPPSDTASHPGTREGVQVTLPQQVTKCMHHFGAFTHLQMWCSRILWFPSTLETKLQWCKWCSSSDTWKAGHTECKPCSN